MTLIVVLFNLKKDIDKSEYESWAQTTDIPTVKKLKSVNRFDVLKATGILGTNDQSPFQYVELLDVSNLQLLGEDIATETMERISAEFQTFADNPLFITTESI